ncbi:universal stress protein [Aquamicrobium sp. NLF2-7]|uniref:universal stress protein n=2 Tax=unclassified Aquamicrobium TaxID=2618194 RepID=UPI001EFAC9C5|nr:universal stress protein [Aquamicrobium sp. NLF2-7]MCG8273458.1 universal stress protein [Aquamicrobium sp. NLF2-7]
MKTQLFVPLVTHPDANADRLAGQVAAIAAGMDAGIHALAINVSIPNVSTALSKLLLNTPDLIRQAEAESRRRGEHLLDLLRENAHRAAAEFDAQTIAVALPLLTETAAQQARYYDFSLVGLDAGNQTARATAEAVVFGSGRPALLVPETTEPSAFDNIAIAWDGSRVAARALADARPFLERASAVSVITVVDEKPLKNAGDEERLAAALRQRGVNATASTVKAQGRPIAEALQQEALQRGCQLLVMGGYGHSRLRDFVLGGATEGVLNNLLMPVLLSH